MSTPVKVGKGFRLQIPVAFREAYNVREGDFLLISLMDKQEEECGLKSREQDELFQK